LKEFPKNRWETPLSGFEIETGFFLPARDASTISRLLER